jgi:hypothetical protein
MATVTAIKVVPHTRIENEIIEEYTPRIGLAGLGVLVMIRSYLNQKTGRCDPSYKTLAKKAGVDRSTIIRYVKKLKAFNLIDPELRFKEDGSYASNQYHFSPAAEQPTAKTPVKPGNPVNQDTSDKGGGTDAPPVVTRCHHPGGKFATTPGAALPPEQSSLLNKTERTSPDNAFAPTEKQQTCPHPAEEIAHLSENIIVCNHCFALLDENPMLATIALPHSPNSALPECEGLSRTGSKDTPGRENPVKSETETALTMARKSHQSAPQWEKTEKATNALLGLGKLILGCLTSV